MKVVGRVLPFHFTVAPLRKLLPFTVRVKPLSPTAFVVGDIEVMLTSGYVMVKVAAPEVPPPGVGVNTVTLADPPLAISEAGILAINCEVLIKFVGRLLPFHLTTDPLIKLEPFTVRLKSSPPEATVDGEIELNVGAGLLTRVNLIALNDGFVEFRVSPVKSLKVT
jgi:hypothetical protein